MGYAHRPVDRDGGALFYGFDAHSGCDRKENCTLSRQSRIISDGLHRTAEYDIARRAGSSSPKRIEHQAAEGYLQALRDRNADIEKDDNEWETGTVKSRDRQQRRNDPHTKWNERKESEHLRIERLIDEAKGAKQPMNCTSSVCGEEKQISMECSAEKSDDKAEMETTHSEDEIGVAEPPVIFSPEEYGALTTHINPSLQPAPRDLMRFDCAELKRPDGGNLIRNWSMGETGTKRSVGVVDYAGAVWGRSSRGIYPT